jgi:hypothetical protein
LIQRTSRPGDPSDESFDGGFYSATNAILAILDGETSEPAHPTPQEVYGIHELVEEEPHDA